MSNFSGKLLRPLTFLFTAVIIISVLMSTALSVSSMDGATYDFSRPNSSHNITLTGADILTEHLGYDLYDAEYEYLKEHSTLSVSYDATITTAYVLTTYEGGVLTVTARPYTYLATNGALVEWIPTEAVIGDKAYPMSISDELYTSIIDSVSEDAQLALTVNYLLSIEISAADISQLLSEAYSDAEYYIDEIPRRIEERDSLIAKYDADLIAYEEYLTLMAEYESEYALYTVYLREKHIYDERLAEYNEYLKNLDEYHAAIENNKNLDLLWEEYYRNYALYLDYLERVKEYEEDLDEYEVYLEKVERLCDQLSAVEAAGVAMTDGRKVYDAIMGDMVTKVLANKTIIAGSLIGASAEVVDAAGEATEDLRVLLPEYFSLETFEERYAYYTINYTALRDSFSLLLKSLDNLYRNPKVRGVIIAEGYNRKYIILVAQLAYISNALSDTTIKSYFNEYTYDDGFTIDGQTVEEILEYKEYLVDTGNAAPDPNGYPHKMEEPIEPEYMAEPVKPSKVEIPAYPPEVQHPGDPPLEVKEPTAPTPIAHPGVRPTPYEAPLEITDLVSAYYDNKLTNRAPTDESYTISLSRSVTKRPFDPNLVTVSFYDYEGVLIDVADVESGSIADFGGELPTRPEDDRAVYTFSHWQDEEGRVADLSSVCEDMALYPVFTEEIKTYTITFRVGSDVLSVDYYYGEMPSYQGAPTKPHDSLYLYTFSSWDRAFETVQGDATYIARFDKEYIFSYSGGGAGITTTDSSIIIDAKGANSPSFDISNILSLVNNEVGKSIVLNTRFADITIPYSVALDMLEDGVSTLSVSTTQVSSYGYKYKLTTDRGAGYRITVSAPYGRLADDGVFYTMATDSERRYVKSARESGIITFTAECGTEYTYIIERSVANVSTSLVTVEVNTDTANPSDTIYVSYTLVSGAELQRLYYVDESGNEVDITGSRFVMPDSDVTVFATARLLEFTIIFKDGRQVIATHTYKYGETVIPPENPKKHSDAVYSYTFLGWRARGEDGAGNIPLVTRDMTYTAVYRSTIIPHVVDDGIKISPSVMRLIVAGVIALALIVVAVIPSVVISIMFLVRYRRLFKRKK